MRELRLALAIAPPFLADLIRALLATRIAAAGYALTVLDEPDTSARARAPPTTPAPDIVIIGPLAPGARASAYANAPASQRLRLSKTLDFIDGPGDAGRAPLTPDELAARVLEIARRIERKI